MLCWQLKLHLSTNVQKINQIHNLKVLCIGWLTWNIYLFYMGDNEDHLEAQLTFLLAYAAVILS